MNSDQRSQAGRGEIPEHQSDHRNPHDAGVPSEARWTSRVTWHNTIFTAVVSVVCVVLGGFGGKFLWASPANNSTSAPLNVTINRLPDGIIEYPYQTLSGTVTGLQPGQMVWTFSQFASSDDPNNATKFYPDTGPCEVNEARHTWVCPKMVIGDPGSAGVGTYKIWVSVVSDEDALKITQKITCTDNAYELLQNPNANVSNCDMSVSDYSPPSVGSVNASTIAKRVD